MIQSSAPSSLQSRLHKHEQFASRLIDEKHDFIVYVPQAFNDDPNRFFPSSISTTAKTCSTPKLRSSRAITGVWARPRTR